MFETKPSERMLVHGLGLYDRYQFEVVVLYNLLDFFCYRYAASPEVTWLASSNEAQRKQRISQCVIWLVFVILYINFIPRKP